MGPPGQMDRPGAVRPPGDGGRSRRGWPNCAGRSDSASSGEVAVFDGSGRADGHIADETDGALRTPGGPQKGLIGNSRFNRTT